MNFLLHARGLAHRFGSTEVFRDLDLTIAQKERVAVLGASGSGKSTLLRLLAGLEKPTGGNVERASGLTVGMVFQDLALWPNLTALDNVAMALPALPRIDRRKAAEAALEKCRVAEFRTRNPGSLSVGQQQRVALARAIASRPQLLLLDEPFSSLDLLLKEELFAVVRECAAECAVVLVTHDPLEALALCERAVVLEDGQFSEQGMLRDLLTSPNSKLLQVFQRRIDHASP
jgi:ABC-type Fe3+/spermidine/putrescine transport system ATPase subunit